MLLLLFLTLISTVSPNFLGIQCGDKVCGRNTFCEDGDDDGVSPKCTCTEGFMGLPHQSCFKSCSNDADCEGGANECVFHDPYFPQFDSINFFMYNYPYAHHHCLNDCAVDDDCGKNAFCKGRKEGNGTLGTCACEKGFVGLPYLQCFDPTPKAIGRSEEEQDGVVKCPILEKTEGMKISCLDRDGNEHDCSNGGIPGTSAMFSCRIHFIPSNYKIKYSRMKCGSNGKWSQYKTFHCKRSAKLHFFQGTVHDPDYY